MIKKRDLPVLVITSLLILCLLVTAGCTSIPGPEPRQTPALEKPPAPVTPQAKTPVLKTATPAASTPGPAATPVAVQTTLPTTPQGTYGIQTCAGLGGAIVRPGGMCPGTWVRATDSFSCCTETPLPSIDRNSTLAIEPLDLVIVMDDAFGSVVP
ncbi:MAG TPA: hypothetical protein HA272_10205 [Methanoregula sp.]|nr:hypothetical protein [Methanoregula sp.]